MDGYLSVRDVSILVRRNEETIRRMIRQDRISVEYAGNGSRQGYLIPVDEVLRVWDITPEAVERYIQHRDAFAGEQARRPLGKERLSEPEVNAITSGIARLTGAVTGLINAGLAGILGNKKTAGGNDTMSDNRPNDEFEKQQEEQRSEWSMPDFSAAGEKVGAVLGEAFNQLRNAVNRAGSAFNAAINQQDGEQPAGDEEAPEQFDEAAPYEDEAPYAADEPAEEPYSDESATAAEDAAREARQEREDVIREAINRGRDMLDGAGKAVSGAARAATDAVSDAAKAAAGAAKNVYDRVSGVFKPGELNIEFDPNDPDSPRNPKDVLDEINNEATNASHQLLQDARKAAMEEAEALQQRVDDVAASIEESAAAEQPAADVSGDIADEAGAAQQGSPELAERIKSIEERMKALRDELDSLIGSDNK